MNLYFDPDALQIEVNQRNQRLTQEYKEAAASQRQLMQKLGAALDSLGKQFVLWGQQIRARSAPHDEREVYHGYPSA